MKAMLEKITTSVTKVTGRGTLIVKKYSPEILLGAGVVGFVGTVVLACKSTLRANEVLEYHNKKMGEIHEAKLVADEDPENELEYDDKLYRQDVVFQYVRTSAKMVKLYAPAIALGSLSVACFLTSRNIMQKRYLGAVAAYNAVSGAFEQYRSRVREEYGENLDRHFRYGTTYESITETTVDEDGKKTKNKVMVENTESKDILPNDFSVFFDESNPNWNSDPSFSMMFLRGQQNYLNDILRTRGHVFLNEVYDALGFEHTPHGAVVGWIAGSGDDCIDFGLYDENRDNARRFVNGQTNTILLEFNHDGVIWDKI